MRLLSELRERLRALVFRGREDRDLDEELAFHLEMEERENLRRGMGPEEARRRAALRLGGVAQVREAARDARGLRGVEDLARDFRLALRRLAREPGFSVPTVATIALGIGASTAVFALVNAVLLAPLPYPDADRLVQVRHAARRAELAVTGLSAGTYLHYREHSRAFEDMAVYMEHVLTLTDAADAPEQVQAALVSPSLFPVLRSMPHLGRFPTAADSGPSGRGGLFISYDLWVRRYGADPGIIGRTIETDRRHDVVVGVAQPGFHFPGAETQVWVGWPPEKLLARYGGLRAGVEGLYMNGVARMRRGTSHEQAERDLGRLVRTLPDVYPDVTRKQLKQMGFRAVVTPLKDAIVGDVRVTLLLLLGTAGFLLLIAWANATNLSLVRAERQRRHLAVERALGASEFRLARRFVSESILMVAVGGALGLTLAYAAVNVRFGFAPEQIPRLREFAIDRSGLGLAVGLTLLTGVLLAAASLHSARRSVGTGTLVGGLGRTMTAGRAEQAKRRLLVAVQVALACTLLIGSVLMARSYWRLQQVELGFEPEGALTFFLPLPSSEYRDYLATARVHQEVLGRIRALPGVEAAEAATVSAFPLTSVPDYYSDRITVADGAATDSRSAPYALFGLATPGYFRAMNIPLLQGRAFQRSDAAREVPAVILSAALAQALLPVGEPIGRKVRLAGTGDRSYTVVGVVGDVPSRAIDEGPAPVVYFPNLSPARVDAAAEALPSFSPREEQYVVRTILPPTSLVAAIRRSIHEVDPKLVMVHVAALEDLVTGSMAHARLTMLLLLVGSATALFLGIIGIYGVLAYTVGQRTPELGVRIALGAKPESMVRMVLRQGALLALAGISAGLIAALVLTRLVGSLLYKVSPSDPVSFVAVAVLLLAVALAASYVPARRAGRIDPVRALKVE